jgi:hypothetical protein
MIGVRFATHGPDPDFLPDRFQAAVVSPPSNVSTSPVM